MLIVIHGWDSVFRQLLQKDVYRIELSMDQNERWSKSLPNHSSGYLWTLFDERISLREYRALGALFIASGCSPFTWRDHRIEADVIWTKDEMDRYPDIKTFKDILLHSNDKINELRRMFGCIVRESLIPHSQRSHGSEAESVVLRDVVRRPVILCGNASLPFDLKNENITGSDMVQTAKLNPFVGKCERALKADGQVKLALLLSGLWRWDEICLYLGCAPGDNLSFVASLRGFKDRWFIGVDPREVKPTLDNVLRRRGWKLKFIRGCFPATRKIILTVLKRMFITSGLSKVLIFSDIRTDDAAENARQGGVDAYVEDMCVANDVATLIEDLQRCVPEIRVRVCLKTKVSEVRTYYPKCNCSMLLAQYSRRPIWEARVYYSEECVSRGHLYAAWHDRTLIDRITNNLVVWNSLPTCVRSWQSTKYLHLSVERHDCVMMMNRSKESNLDLFYATHARNAKSDIISLACSSACVTYWTGGRCDYSDDRFFPNLGTILMWTLDLKRILLRGDVLFSLCCKEEKLPVHVTWASSFLCVLDSAVLDDDSRMRLSFNTYDNCQTFGFRESLNQLRIRGDTGMSLIDDFRNLGMPDRFSGHLLGMLLLIEREYMWYDVVRWINLVLANIEHVMNGSASYSKYDQKPECRKGITLWHTDVHLLSTCLFLSDSRLLDCSLMRRLFDYIVDKMVLLPASRCVVVFLPHRYSLSDMKKIEARNPLCLQIFCELYGYYATLQLVDEFGGLHDVSESWIPNSSSSFVLCNDASKQMVRMVDYCIEKHKALLIRDGFERFLFESIVVDSSNHCFDVHDLSSSSCVLECLSSLIGVAELKCHHLG